MLINLPMVNNTELSYNTRITKHYLARKLYISIFHNAHFMSLYFNTSKWTWPCFQVPLGDLAPLEVMASRVVQDRMVRLAPLVARELLVSLAIQAPQDPREAWELQVGNKPYYCDMMLSRDF